MDNRTSSLETMTVCPNKGCQGYCTTRRSELSASCRPVVPRRAAPSRQRQRAVAFPNCEGSKERPWREQRPVACAAGYCLQAKAGRVAEALLSQSSVSLAGVAKRTLVAVPTVRASAERWASAIGNAAPRPVLACSRPSELDGFQSYFYLPFDGSHFCTGRGRPPAIINCSKRSTISGTCCPGTNPRYFPAKSRAPCANCGSNIIWFSALPM